MQQNGNAANEIGVRPDRVSEGRLRKFRSSAIVPSDCNDPKGASGSAICRYARYAFGWVLVLATGVGLDSFGGDARSMAKSNAPAAGGQVPSSPSPHLSGTSKPWTRGATPESIYTHLDPNTGEAIQNAIYDANGDVIGHVDFTNHGMGATSGHGHFFGLPGYPSSGHGAAHPHIPNHALPAGWDALPAGVNPRTPLGL
jgi:hypothetical protein